MKILPIFLLFILVLSCKKREEYRILIPEETHITSESILTELENKAAEDPENDRLIKQQLNFCEQLNWPARCEKVLIIAKSKWGLDEKLLDQSVAYYIRHEEFDRVESLLKGKFETRKRLETRIQIALRKGDPIAILLNRYLDQYNDLHAHILGATGFLQEGDTALASKEFEEIYSEDPSNKVLNKYITILERQKSYKKAVRLLELQLIHKDQQEKNQLRIALNRHQFGDTDSAKSILRKVNKEEAFTQLYEWFKEEANWDSCIFYTNQLLVIDPSNKDYLLAKAESLESKGWLTPSLPYFEQALALDTSNIELTNRVKLIKRKVAYLRRKREKEEVIPPPVERKTAN